MLAKVYRVADRVAERMGKEPVECGDAQDMAGAVTELDAVIAWCERLVARRRSASSGLALDG